MSISLIFAIIIRFEKIKKFFEKFCPQVLYGIEIEYRTAKGYVHGRYISIFVYID